MKALSKIPNQDVHAQDGLKNEQNKVNKNQKHANKSYLIPMTLNTNI